MSIHLMDASLLPSEQCNQIDDDNDGLTDEGFDLGTPCQTSTGRCQTSGQLMCDARGEVVCNAPVPIIEQERCNEQDDDCDGRIDEGFDVGLPCTNALGQCAVIGRSVCSEDEQSVRCQASSNPPSTERCNEIDDDCDGSIDEDFAKGKPCSIGLGVCEQEGVTGCTQDGAISCNAQITPPSAETCNRIDDDCDGITDEHGCTDLIIDNCLPSIVWRTDLDAPSCRSKKWNARMSNTHPTTSSVVQQPLLVPSPQLPCPFA